MPTQVNDSGTPEAPEKVPSIVSIEHLNYWSKLQGFRLAQSVTVTALQPHHRVFPSGLFIYPPLAFREWPMLGLQPSGHSGLSSNVAFTEACSDLFLKPRPPPTRYLSIRFLICVLYATLTPLR